MPKTELSFATNEPQNPMTSKSSKYNNPTQDYEDYLRKANYKTSSDCLSAEKSASN